MTDRPIRASDRERECVVDVLRDAYTEGRLTLDEFFERTAAAYAAKTWDDLRELTGDLPVQPVLGAGLPQRRPSAAPVPALTPVKPARRHPRDRPLGRLLPVLFAWILISAAVGSPHTATALAVVFLCLLACHLGYGRRGGRRLPWVTNGKRRHGLTGNVPAPYRRTATMGQPAWTNAHRSAASSGACGISERVGIVSDRLEDSGGGR
jgi:hypothetical protein